MAKRNIWVRPTARGQRPDTRMIVDAGSDPFRVSDVELKNATWLQRLKPSEAEALQKRLDAERQQSDGDDDADLNAVIHELQRETAEAQQRIAQLEADNADLSEQLAKANADAAAAIAKANELKLDAGKAAKAPASGKPPAKPPATTGKDG